VCYTNALVHVGYSVRLQVQTAKSWYDHAADNLDILLIDHAHCEKKAASFGLGLIYRYLDRPKLLLQISSIVREEMLHFEQVLGLMAARNITFRSLAPCRYMGALRRHVRTTEPGHLIDLLLIAAMIEARSCERFLGLAQVLDAELALFYRKLHRAEARHASVYVALAVGVIQDRQAIERRLADWLTIEARLIEQQEGVFRFHSGVPVMCGVVHGEH
jgi:tRNA 2-(methylsulfanyl)-N6-isopentenyladenosine37 hydroxylase